MRDSNWLSHSCSSLKYNILKEIQSTHNTSKQNMGTCCMSSDERKVTTEEPKKTSNIIAN